jgi:glucan 1,3-beta-glucosidase
MINSSIIDYYYTQIIGNPNCIPTLKATANFTGFGLIDGDPYGANGLSYGSTNVFWRQIRNFYLDMTRIPANSSATGIHWPTAQATSLQNIVFHMSDALGTKHQGIFIESGSGGFMNDLVFYGGLYGGNFGNQQFTMRNLTFYNAVTAINQLWDWGWTYQTISINNCSVGLNMSSGGATGQSVGSITFFDSSISNTSIGIITAHSLSQPTTMTNGSLILENVALNNVPVAVQGPANTVALAGTPGALTISAWGQGHSYTPNGPAIFEGPIAPNTRPSSLLNGNGYYARSKPQYENVPVSQFLSTRSAGASGDGITDDTMALQNAINSAAASGKVLFFDAGTYKVTSTLNFLGNSKIVGESYSVIMGSGAVFENMTVPQPIVRIGQPGEIGYVEWSDMIVSTQGATAGAVLIEWNLSSSGGRTGPKQSGWPAPSTLSAPSASITYNAPVTHSGPGAKSAYTSGPPSGQPSSPPSRRWATPPANDLNGQPSGMWDVHARIGGFAGSSLQLAQCPTTPNITIPPGTINRACIAAFMTMHITPSASNLYLENVWLWTADHDVEDASLTPITVYTGRGLYVEPTSGPIWLVATAVEHHTLYQYQFANTQSIFMGQIQTETAYYQPNPPAYLPFPAVASINDPDFTTICSNSTTNCDGYGLRILNSSSILTYGAGLYSFFNNYNTSCSAAGNGETCQPRISSLEGSLSDIDIYNVNTVGATSMINRDGLSLASYADNVNVFPDTIALFRTG